MTNILLIEDDKIILEMYKDKFTQEKFSVQTAVDGQDGIEKMKTSLPDVILLDLIMPKVNGFEFLKIVKANPTFKNIPILVLTNIYADAQDLVQNWGVEYFLLKSNQTPEGIVKKVKELLASKSPPPAKV